MEDIWMGEEGFSILLNKNFKEINTLATPFAGVLSATDKDFMVWDSSATKWVMTKHSEDQLTHGLGGRTEDITFNDPNKGVVLVDRADNSKKYRLYVENGVLKLENL